ncbi:S-adenosyl-L-methionine-dependent methyltransferase, partial [Rozella allomycis CSF55]
PMLKCLEFFSGVGGWHLALTKAGLKFEILQAFDINENANQVYEYNFGIKPSKVKNNFIFKEKIIDRLTVNELEKLAANTWLMSPCCQPFTLNGTRLDDKDNRSKPLLNLIDILATISSPPGFIALENVPLFEGSNCCNKLKTTLKSRGYLIKEYIVSPKDIGNPNDRKRYFLVALNSDSELLHQDFLPQRIDRLPMKCPEMMKLREFLDVDVEYEYFLTLPDVSKLKNFRHDVVSPESSNCSTFTSSYEARHLKGSGSILQTKNFGVWCYFFEFDRTNPDHLIHIGVRLFTPNEIMKIHGYPPEFKFPKQISIKQMYRLLGNGLHISCVSEVLRHAVMEKES